MENIENLLFILIPLECFRRLKNKKKSCRSRRCRNSFSCALTPAQDVKETSSIDDRYCSCFPRDTTPSQLVHVELNSDNHNDVCFVAGHPHIIPISLFPCSSCRTFHSQKKIALRTLCNRLHVRVNLASSYDRSRLY